MTRFKQGIVALLLCTSLVLTVAEAYARVPPVCGFVGCTMGPDTCMTISVGIGFVDVSVTCYSRLPTTTN